MALNYLQIFTLTYSLIVLNTAQPSFTCGKDDFWSNGYGGDHARIVSGQFMAGMYGIFNKTAADRVFSWKHCGPVPHQEAQSYYTLYTVPYGYHGSWISSCSEFNGGNSAIFGAESYYYDAYKDRIWAFLCTDLDPNYKFNDTNCTWSGYINNMTEPLNYECPANTVMRGIASYRDDDIQDSSWDFECCTVLYSEQGYEALVNGNEEESQNEAFLVIASVSAGIAILCIIIGLYVYKRKRKARSTHKYAVNAQDNDNEDVEMRKSAGDGEVTNIQLINEE